MTGSSTLSNSHSLMQQVMGQWRDSRAPAMNPRVLPAFICPPHPRKKFIHAPFLSYFYNLKPGGESTSLNAPSSRWDGCRCSQKTPDRRQCKVNKERGRRGEESPRTAEVRGGEGSWDEEEGERWRNLRRRGGRGTLGFFGEFAATKHLIKASLQRVGCSQTNSTAL